MRQRIEKHQETRAIRTAVTVMFHDRRVVLAGLDSARALRIDASTLSAHLAGDSSVCSASSSLSRLLKASDLNESARYRTRRRKLDTTEFFVAEELLARSAKTASAVNPSKSSGKAATAETTAITEQHYRLAA